jgi:hypothetical protein
MSVEYSQRDFLVSKWLWKLYAQYVAVILSVVLLSRCAAVAIEIPGEGSTCSDSITIE